MKAPIVRERMTRLHVEIERVDNVANAIRLMELFDVRHVPVMNGSHLEGVISERDILRARIDTDIDDISLQEICSRNVLTVGPLTPVDQVAQQMLERRVGSAIVVDGGYVVGIFTSSDALRTLTEIFGKHAKNKQL